MAESQTKREPLLILTGARGVGKSFLHENRPDAFLLTEKFMYNLKIGDSFTLNKRSFFVKRIGKFNSKISGKDKSYKKLVLKSYNEKVDFFIDESKKRYIKQVGDKKNGNADDITFYFMGGIHGNPKSRQKNSDAKQHNFLRNIEGQLIVDLINYNNPLHEMSEIYKIANQ